MLSAAQRYSCDRTSRAGRTDRSHFLVVNVWPDEVVDMAASASRTNRRYTERMADLPNCPICTMPDPLTTDDGYECATCGHEWMGAPEDDLADIRDANGNVLADGDAVTIIKDLKTDGKAGGVKAGTKIKSIRLISGDHEIDGKVDGRQLLIKAEFVKKA